MAEYSTNSDINLALHDYIVDSIIPKMDTRRGRTEALTMAEIHAKITRDVVSGKPGEEWELLQEIHRDVDGIDGQFANEIADQIYYASQPNCSKEDARIVHKWLKLIEIPYTLAQEFCIVKYETRIKYGDGKDHKQIENRVLDKYIDRYYPYLKTIWENPSLE